MVTGHGRDSVTSVANALALLQVFSPEAPRLTISDAARLTGVTRPSARRLLLTFAAEGFVESDGKYFWLTPKVMRLGFSFLSTLPFWEIAQPHMRLLADSLQESTSMATLDDLEIVYVLRIPVRSGLIPLNVGSRLPAHATSLGKALLAFANQQTQDELLARAPFERLTEHTIVEADDLRREFERVRDRGYATADSERDIGVRSAAVPILDRSGSAFAAINVSANSMRISREELESRFVIELHRTADAISAEIAYGVTR